MIGFMEKDSFIETPGKNVLGLSPHDAMVQAKLGWLVDTIKDPIVSLNGENYTSNGYQAIARSDTKEILGFHGPNYKPVQNTELFDVAESVANLQTNSQIESAGSFKNGRQVFCLVRTESIGIGNDEVAPYLAIRNSHDGTTGFSMVPTSMRIVCQNTLNMAFNVPKEMKYTFFHTGDIEGKIEQAKIFLKKAHSLKMNFHATMKEMSSKKMNNTSLTNFYSKAYDAHFKPPAKEEENKKKIQTVEGWINNMEVEMIELGEDSPNLWLAANSVTSSIQKQDPKRKIAGWQERDVDSRWFGKKANESNAVFRNATQLVF